MIRRILVWLLRIGNCKGFGIQSPWAYAFVCDVINERWPYYAYERLEEKYRDESATKRRLARLYLRIANFMQPDVVLCLGKDSEMCREYLKCGCLKASDITNNTNNRNANATKSGVVPDAARLEAISNAMKSGRMLMWIAADDDAEEHVSRALELLEDDGMLIIEGIHNDRRVKGLWKDVLRRDHIIAFDLYYCGIVYKDSKRYAQNYIVNF